MQNYSWLSRTELLTGREKLEDLAQKHVLIVGLGGVGSYAAEAICRAGIGNITIVDGDAVDPTNKNRQLVDLDSTKGKLKADIMADRMFDINPEVNLTVHREFLEPDKMRELLSINSFDYVMDCIDSVTPKITLISQAYEKGLKLASSMGAGGKMDPTKVQAADFSETNNCKLAKYLRKRLHRMNIYSGFKVVFSPEPISKDFLIHTDGSNYKRSAYGTISYMPAVFGLTLASIVIRDLLNWKSVEKNC